MTTQFWKRLTIEAYLCASKCLAKIEVGSSKYKSYDEHHWFLVTVDEVKAHFVLCILMSRKRKEVQSFKCKVAQHVETSFIVFHSEKIYA
jgi:hypothetical protein